MSEVTYSDFLDFAKANSLKFLEFEAGTSTDWRDFYYPYTGVFFSIWETEFYFETQLSRLKKGKRHIICHRLKIDGLPKALKITKLENNFENFIRFVERWAKEDDSYLEYVPLMHAGYSQIRALKMKEGLDDKLQRKSFAIKEVNKI